MNDVAIRIINGKEVPCKLTKLEWRSMEVELVPSNLDDVEDLSHDCSVGCHVIDEMPELKFSFQGKIYSAKSTCGSSNRTFGKTGTLKEATLRLSLYNLRCQECLQLGDRILFYIPHYPSKPFWEEGTYWTDKQNKSTQWQRDLCRLKIKGREWIIRRALLDAESDIPKPYDLFPRRSKPDDVCGCFLETRIQDCETISFLFDMAEDLCRLEGLAVGHFIMWQTAWISRSNEYFLFSASSIRTSSRQFSAVYTIKYVPNISPGCILSSTIENYLADKDTWNHIMYWFLASLYNAPYVHVALHLQFPLLERIVDNAFLALTEGFTGVRIARDNFKSALKKAKRAIKRFLPKEVSHEESAFAETDGFLRLWLSDSKDKDKDKDEDEDKATYKNKIIYLFKYAGYILCKEEINELSERNSLAHSVYLRTKGALAIHHLFNSITKKIYALILAMLGYGEYFIIFNSKYCISSILPMYDRISLPALRETGRQYRLHLNN